MKIVLTMIVKDEEHVIERVLRSCIRLIDHYVIVDTGSTDNTIETITNFFDKYPSITGEIVSHQFTNFSECRNIALHKAKEYGDWGFWIDADETLSLDIDFHKDDLSKYSALDAMMINCDYNNINYNRTQFYNLSSNWKWVGPVHEILQREGDSKINLFTEGKVIIKSDGSSWSSNLVDKYKKHADMLVDYIDNSGDKSPRWVFYLAQSYKDIGLMLLSDNRDESIKYIEKAIAYYKERLTLSGFTEELYYSQLCIGRLMHSLSYSINEVLFELTKCEEYNSSRIEHLYSIISILTDAKLWNTARFYADMAVLRTYFEHGDFLFKESMCYSWQLLDKYSIILFYSGYKEECIKIIDTILQLYPNNEDVDRIKNNKKLAEDSLKY